MSAQQVLFDAPGPRARARHRILAVIGVLLLLAALAWVLERFNATGQLEAAKWTPFLEWSTWRTYLIPGVIDVLRAAVVAILISMVFALGLAMARMSDIAPVRWLASIFVEFFRAVPVLIMMIFTFFFLSYNAGTPDSWNPFLATVTGLVLYNSSVLCEVIRNGVYSLPAGQREAGLSIGLSPSQVRRSIQVPQALTAMLPVIVSQIVVITKDTALGYIILYPELITQARRLASQEFNVVPAYLVAAVLFILINYGLSKLAELVEARQRRKAHTAGAIGSADAIRAEARSGRAPTGDGSGLADPPETP